MTRLHQAAFWRSFGGVATGIALGATALVVGPLAGVASATPLTFTVNKVSNVDDPTPDGVCGSCSLREAIHEANANPGPDTINFNVPAPYRILLTSALPQIVSPVTIDGTSLPSFDPATGVMVRIDGNVATTGITSLLRIAPGGAGSTIKGLDLVRAGVGIDIRGDDNTVTGVYGGITQTGSTNCGTTCALNNGVRIVDGSNNTIGGTTAAERNVLSNNAVAGVNIQTSEGTSADNVVQGNYLGTNPAGTLARPNMFGYTQFGDTQGTMVGGSTPGAGNLASGNVLNGIIFEEGTGQIAGNIVGLRAAGDKALPNHFGGVIVEELTHDVTVGGDTNDFRNVISGNAAFGLLVEGEDGLDHNIAVKRNFVGTDVTGILDRGNDGLGIDIALDTGTVVDSNVVAGNSGDQVRLAGCADCNPVLGTGQQLTGNIIGLGSNGLARLTSGGRGVFVDDGVSVTIHANTISGNTQEGIFLQQANDTEITSNLIGTDEDGNLKRGNGGPGISGVTVSSSTIGEIDQGNLISGNTDVANQAAGVVLTSSTDVRIQANKIGTKLLGNIALGNTSAGVIVSGSDGVQVGGTLPGQGNVIAANKVAGVWFSGTDNSTVIGNFIGVGANGTKPLGNDGMGVALLDGSDHNTVGDGSSAARNLIANNSGSGVVVVGSTGNTIRNNLIKANGKLGIDLEGDDAVLANDVDDVDGGANNGQNYPVLTSSTSGLNTVVSGTFNSTASRQFIVDFYASTSCDASGNGEGTVYLGSTFVTTDASGDATIGVSTGGSGVGDSVTATATDLTTDDTSEFSACVTNS